MNGGVVSFDTTGVEKMIKALNKIEVSPQKAVNKGTSKANLLVKRTIKRQVPVRTGTLKKNIVTKTERNHGIQGRKVREVTFKGGRDANQQLQRDIKHPGALGGKNPKAYYPASMEYGFLARAKGGGVVFYNPDRGMLMRKEAAGSAAGGTKRVEGRHFMRDAAESVSTEAKQLMIKVMEEELDKLWQEAQHS